MKMTKIWIGAIIGGLVIGLAVEIAGVFAGDFFRWSVIGLAAIGVIAVVVAAIFGWPWEKGNK